MKIEVSLTPALYPFRTLTAPHVTVAIDLLRATTAVCAAFQAGCREIVPLDRLEALEAYRPQGYKIAAERGGKKLAGSEYGNSPTEYLRHDMTGVRLAYSTTNGTVSILRSADAALSLTGCFANLTALCDRLRQEKMDVVLLCSGWKNDFCLEDTLVAGAIMEKLSGSAEPVGDAAYMAKELWQQAKEDPYSFCRDASHVHRLERMEAHDDVVFAFKQDTCPVVPVLKDGVLTL
ncbi:MAG: 2-phosphosulfolactate phosphatase [Bacteroidales bacterium]|nr:2-phosphosulfolactate phosphatase [Bacteroidales bacterium]